MGLFSFGLAVMASYAIFFTEARAAAIAERTAAMARLLAARALRNLHGVWTDLRPNAGPAVAP